MTLVCYTDGSCLGNGKGAAQGGWAYFIMDKDTAEVYFEATGTEENTTNQRMELMAAIRCLKCIDGRSMRNTETKVIINSDSAYLVNCVNQKWWVKWLENDWVNSKKQPVANRDLWEELISYFKDSNIIFTKVKGHAEDDFNNRVDEMARKSASSDWRI